MSVGCKYLLGRSPPSPLILAGKLYGHGVGAVREEGLWGGGRGVAGAAGVADGGPGQAPDGLPRAGDDGGDLSVGQPRHVGGSGSLSATLRAQVTQNDAAASIKRSFHIQKKTQD